jgi:uncharacterized protein YjbI with pentapeptide repeats
MPGLHVEITLDDLRQYKTQHPYGDVSLREWTYGHYNIPEYQPIQSLGLSNLNLKGEDLTFVDFQGLSITDCEIDTRTRFAGASFQDSNVINTPIGNALDLGYSQIVGINIDEPSTKSIDNQKLLDQFTDLGKSFKALENYILKSDEELKDIIRKTKDAFEANIIATFLEKRTGEHVELSRDINSILKHRITKFMPNATIADALFTNINKANIRLYPEDLEAIQAICNDISQKITAHSTPEEMSDIATNQIPKLIEQWKEETQKRHKDFDYKVEIIAHSNSIKKQATFAQETRNKSLLERGLQGMKRALYEIGSGLKPTIVGGTAGAALGIAQADSLKSAAVKGGLGAVLGAAAVNAIPERFSPIAPSDWPAIDPKDEALKSRDVQLKLRGLFWCAMLSGGAIEGITGATLGIETISTITSSFGLVKTLVSAQEFNINDDPKNMSSIVSRGVKKLDGVLSKYQESLDSQLGDRLLEIGTIMEQIEPRLGVIMLNRKIMQVTQFGSPGFLGDMLSMSQSIQNFFSFWSIKNNYYAVTDSLKKEQEKPFMDRNRPGSPVLTKEIEEKMWLKKVSLRSMTTVLGLSILIVLGIATAPLFGAAAAAIGMKAAIIATSAAIAVATTGYIGYSALKGTSIKNITAIFMPAKPTAPTKPGAKELSKPHEVEHKGQQRATPHHTASHVARLEEKRGKGHDQHPESQVERLKRTRSHRDGPTQSKP